MFHNYLGLINNKFVSACRYAPLGTRCSKAGRPPVPTLLQRYAFFADMQVHNRLRGPFTITIRKFSIENTHISSGKIRMLFSFFTNVPKRQTIPIARKNRAGATSRPFPSENLVADKHPHRISGGAAKRSVRSAGRTRAAASPASCGKRGPWPDRPPPRDRTQDRKAPPSPG